MLTHAQIWNAIDALARRQGMTPSALAKRAGLDATTFNKSKRQSAEGHPRWPSTESIAKILAATQVSIDDFLDLISSENPTHKLPFRVMEDVDASSFDDGGQATGAGWDQIEVPGADHADAFAIGISGDAHAPVYRDGAVLIASSSSPRRRGDRIMLFARDGTLTLAELGHETSRQLQLRGLDGSDMPPQKMSDLRLIARILWVSQ
ncbi:MAG: helix-turn-helix transcriptional regulator [Rhizobiales bacterium]|nr:helix-turn-helix transcriptional regulator [Hyphomicrobiales bacterium]